MAVTPPRPSGIRSDIFGWFADASPIPKHDPGVDGIICPVCAKELSRPVVTISLMVPGDSKSYFYRLHKACHSKLAEDDACDLDSSLIDMIAEKSHD